MYVHVVYIWLCPVTRDEMLNEHAFQFAQTTCLQEIVNISIGYESWPLEIARLLKFKFILCNMRSCYRTILHKLNSSISQNNTVNIA